jgi:hypothetical protein
MIHPGLMGKKFELASGHHYNAPASGNNLSKSVSVKISPPNGLITAYRVHWNYWPLRLKKQS